ncbi:sensor histidine kinase [Candidatus Latescibacterota bacterium]
MKAMKIAGTTLFYVVLVWILVIILFGSVLYMGYTRNVNDLQQLMLNEAKRLTDIVTVSTAVGIDALEDIEYLIANRLLDNARHIDRLSSEKLPSAESLSSIAFEHDLHTIEILDKTGNIVVRNNFSEKSPDLSRESYEKAIDSVLSGVSNGEFIGFDTKSYSIGFQRGVIMPRGDGGAVIIITTFDKMQEFRKSFGLGTLGTLFNGISRDEGVSYIVLQDTLGIVVASPNVSEITRIKKDPFLVNAYDKGWDYRTIRVDGEGILEVVSPLVMYENDYGLLRIGLNTFVIEEITQRTTRHFIILFAISIFSGAFLFLYVMLRQNYMILNNEHDNILKEVKSMEEETRRSERLASMGYLAAGVAHEIRNPLNSISLIVQQLKGEIKHGDKENEHIVMLSTVGNEITRISSIIEHFLRYAKLPDLSLSSSSLENLISEVLSIVEITAESNKITINSEIESGITCELDKDQLKQAIVNIVLNAVDEIKHDGHITIKAGKYDNNISFRIEDSGKGIDKDILPKIFDPFFTTKDSGNGLGLSEVHRIVTAHGGRITAENAEDYGAVFTIKIPCGES